MGWDRHGGGGGNWEGLRHLGWTGGLGTSQGRGNGVPGAPCGHRPSRPASPWHWPHILSPTAQLASPLQDHPHSADGHAPDPASGQGSQCDSPKQMAGQESPTLPVPSAVKVMPVPPGCPGDRISPGHLAASKPEVPMCCTPHVWGVWGFGLKGLE